MLELPADSNPRGLDERDSARDAERSPLGVWVLGNGGLSRICLGDSVWRFFALMGVALEKLMGKRVRPGCCFLAARLDAALVEPDSLSFLLLFMGLH